VSNNTNGPRPLNERNFSLQEVCVLMILELHNLDNRRSREAWMECGAPGEVFDRVHKRLLDEGVLLAHPRRSNITQTANVYLGLRGHYEMMLLQAALAEEAR
jgi:hypothetical protein